MIDCKCPVCGVTYQADEARLRHGRQTTCSRKCSYELRANKLERRVVVNCAVCNKEIERPLTHVKGKHGANFCSRACHYQGRTLGLTKRVVVGPYTMTVAGISALRASQARVVAKRKAANNYGHSDETRRKMSDASARALAEGRVSRVSKLEDKVAKVLDDLGIGYQRQVGIRGDGGRYVGVVDFVLDDGVVLEVNGTYWHADPRVYSEHNATQTHNVQKFAAKLSRLREKGICVAEVWELDFDADPTEAVIKALGNAF